MELLTDFDYGRVSRLDNGQTLREYAIAAFDKEIEIAPGVFFPAWTYNGRVPGPTLRCTEGDRLRITFANAGSHPHTIHFHGIHTDVMDGVPGSGRGWSRRERPRCMSSTPSRSAATCTIATQLR